MKKLALIAALSVVGIANAQAADGTITINGLVTALYTIKIDNSLK